jgi:hypothetical protein
MELSARNVDQFGRLPPVAVLLSFGEAKDVFRTRAAFTEWVHEFSIVKSFVGALKSNIRVKV